MTKTPQAQERDRIRREKLTPPAKEPDADFWTRRREYEWDLLDAVLLLMNLEPREGLGRVLRTFFDPYSDSSDTDDQSYTDDPAWLRLSDDARQCLETFSEILEMARMAAEHHRLSFLDRTLREPVQPRAFLLWAREKGYPVPPAIAPIIADVPGRAEFEAEVKLLKDELAQTWDQFDPNDPCFPKELDIAFQAWRAVSTEKSSSTASVRQRLEHWIKSRYPDLPPEAIKRIAIVASWQRKRGRKPKQRGR